MDSSRTQALFQEFGAVDPRAELARISAQKGEVLDQSCLWVFEDEAFEDWVNGTGQGNILWIHGDPGKGKLVT